MASASISAPKPSLQKIEMPPHEYLRPPEIGFPLKKILAHESELAYAKLHPAAQLARLMGLALIIGIYATISLTAAFAISMTFPLWAAILAIILLALPFALSEGIEIIYLLDAFRFSLQEEYLFVRAGAIDPKYELVPYENIQDAQVSQDGLFDKLFNVSSVMVSTPASSILISYLPNEKAKKFREDLLTLARAHKNMAE